MRLALALLFSLACYAQEAAPPAVEEAVAPAYPAAALTGRVSGSVIVAVHISDHGAVTSASVVDGNALLRQASLEAARLWRFHAQPAADVKLIFSYRLMPKNTPEAQLGTVFRPPYTVEVRRMTPEPVSHFAASRGISLSPALLMAATGRPGFSAFLQPHSCRAVRREGAATRVTPGVYCRLKPSRASQVCLPAPSWAVSTTV